MLLKTLLLVLLAFQYVDGSARILYVSEVISEDNSSFCQSESCYDSFDRALANVTSNDVINIITDSTLSFYNILTDCENVSIIGYNNPTIHCNNTTDIIGALQIISCNNCIIRGLTWSGCGVINNGNMYPVIKISNSSNVTIEDCNFQYSNGQAIALSEMVGNATISHCTFAQNTFETFDGAGAVIDIINQQNPLTIRDCNFTNNQGVSQGVINIGQSSDESLETISFCNLVFSKNKGTAIYLNHQDLHLCGKLLFEENTAENGAGMFITNGSRVFFDNSSYAEFTQNRATGSGGAIFISNHSTISLGQASKFINNEADNNGGAIALLDHSHINNNHSIITKGLNSDSIPIHGEALFLSNTANRSGGAVFINNHSSFAFGQNSTFINNTANNIGGAMALYDSCSITNEEDSIVSFNSNVASQFGGALHLSTYSNVSFTQNATLNFDKNIAGSDYGAAVFSEFYSTILFEGNSTASFYNNFPPNNSTMYSINTSFVIILSSNVTFNGNVAKWNYGSTYIKSNDVIINADGIVRCSDYREYYICNNQACHCQNIVNVTSNSEVTITDDINISTPIELEELGNVSLIGHNNAIILYQEGGELKFRSCQNLKISGLTWNRRPSERNPNPILTFSDVNNITLMDCSFQYSVGQAVSLSNVSGYVNISRCKFVHNQSNRHGALIYYLPDYNDNTNMLTIADSRFSNNRGESLIFLEPSEAKSVHVVLRDSEFIDNHGVCIHGSKQTLYIEGTVSFKNNEAVSGAGMFITNNSNITFCSDSNVTFHQNQVDDNGAAIYLSDSSHIVFQNNSRVVFSSNTATMSGGAIYSDDSSSRIIFMDNSNVTLTGNRASQSGGAIYSTDCKILLKGNSSFNGNGAMRGGAIFSTNNCDIKFQNNAYVIFKENTASQNGGGGSLYTDGNSSITFEGDSTVIFNKSRAFSSNGGAIYSHSSDISFTGSSKVTFDDNQVFNGNGGAVFFEDQSNVIFQGMSMITFKNNRATNGGALHFHNSSVGFADNSCVIFSKNDAAQWGGGVYLQANDISFNDNSIVEFSNNTALHGGGVYTAMRTITIEGMSNITFIFNEATQNGGSILSNGSSITFSNNSSTRFSKNNAIQGGAIYSTSRSNVVFQSCVTFSENEASRHGGSMYLGSKSSITFGGDSTVIYNKNKAPNGDGGAIYCDDNSDMLIQEMSKTIFNENNAIDGGALHLQYQSHVEFENDSLTVFSGNRATLGGAINIGFDTYGTFCGNARLLFCNNSATDSGGAIYLDNNVSLSFESRNEDSLVNCTGTCNDALANTSDICIEMLENTSTVFYQNHAETGGAIFLATSEIKFDGTSVVFSGNTASQDGGAVYLSDEFTLAFINDCDVKFLNNSANYYGGAIMVIDIDENEINFESDNILFEKNDASLAGDSVYINIPQGCEGCLNSIIQGNGNNFIRHTITSPRELKLYNQAQCIERDDNTCKLYHIENIMLGQEILLDACMYDYYGKEANAAQFLVSANTNVGSQSISNEDFTLALNTMIIFCNLTAVPYIRINARTDDDPTSYLPFNYSMNIDLLVSRFSESTPVFATLTVELSTCHPGFYYKDKQCRCYDTDSNTVVCSGSSSTIRRGYWFGILQQEPTVTFCPINYCNFSCCETFNGYYELSPTRINQCRSHRTGTACGNCEPGYILPYDSADCIEEDECTPAHIALVVMLTVVYWIVLFVAVSAIVYFKVEIGHLYGLTYYYSIIDIVLSQNLQLSNGFFTVVNILSSIAKVTPQFLGPLCLFKEMTGIDQQFIHYIHPVAFSLILIMISILAKLSRRLTEFISRVIIPIICFLLLLSYTSVATTSLLLMRPLLFHNVDKVYTYLTPDVEYFHDRHLGYSILAILSTIVIVIFLPLLFLAEPFLNSKINFVKIKPLLDQFQGCYKDKYRSFAGYYMVCRLVIITLIIANSSNDDFIIQHILITTVSVITALIHLVVRPYAKLVLNIFDGVVLTILIVVTVLPFIQNRDNFLVLALAYILVLLPLIIFITMELVINKKNIKEMMQHVKSKLSKEKNKKNDNGGNEVPVNDMNREIGIIVDESMRKNATIVDVDNDKPEERLPEIPWTRDSFIQMLDEIKD